jgi:hypothetical protein
MRLFNIVPPNKLDVFAISCFLLHFALVVAGVRMRERERERERDCPTDVRLLMSVPAGNSNKYDSEMASQFPASSSCCNVSTNSDW